MRRFGQVLAQAAHLPYGVGGDRSPAWLRHLCGHLRDQRRGGDTDRDDTGFATAPRLREMLALDGTSVGPLVDILFDNTRYSTPAFRDLPGLPEVLEAEVEAVLAEARHLSAEGRGRLLLYLSGAGVIDRVPAYFDLAFATAAAKARAAREPAIAALMRVDHRRVESRAVAALGASKVDERVAGVTVLAELLGADALPRLDAHRAAEKAKPVLQLIETLRPKLALAEAAAAEAEADGPEAYTALDGTRVAAPPRGPADDRIPDDTAEVLAALMAEAASLSRQEYDNPPDLPGYSHEKRGRYRPPLDPRTIPDLVRVMTGDWPRARAAPFIDPHIDYTLPQTRQAYARGLTALLERPDFGLKPLARLFAAGAPDQVWSYRLRAVIRGERHHGLVEGALAKRVAAGADFRDVVDALEERGHPAADGLPRLLQDLAYLTGDEPEAPNPTLWPVLAAHLAVIEERLLAQGAERRSAAHGMTLALCGLFPKAPRRFLDPLLDIAVGGSSADRRRARALLAQAGDLTPVIVPLLGDGAGAKRAAAARWLGERRHATAIPSLRAALAREKHVAAKAAILGALQACGDDISDQFSEGTLLDEARHERSKLKVGDLGLLAADQLPALRWADGRPVDPAIVDYWFARAHKLKAPGGAPLLHMALDRLDRDDSAAMGRLILSSFIQLDTVKASSDEANAYAQANAAGRHQAYQRWNTAYTYEEAFASLRQEKLGEYLGSALDHRGLLGLARYAPPAEAVAQVRRYFRDHGKRANQCRALLDMLAANPVPQVLQFVLDVAQRHKQPGTRKYAGELAGAIAEERGWTPAEMADRTVPSLDLDEQGARALPIGDKVFRLRLDDALKLVVENPAGKVVASLPSPADPAEAEQAAAARKALSAARKELQQTVELQTRRLYEAMCVGRRWGAAEFEALFVAHPILSRLLRRLVVAGHDAEGGIVGSARLLDDGSFTDAEDGSVRLDAFDTVSLAHRATLGEAAAEAWVTHLADYEVAPLFPQFSRPLLALPDPKVTEVADRQGYMVDSLTLRSVTARLGYAQGSVEDGGCFMAYEKAFPELGLAAVVGFSGGFMGDTERRPCALHGLSFVPARQGKASGWGAQGVALGKVPPVLLQEAWNDYRTLAAAGTGFDPDWRKKGLW